MGDSLLDTAPDFSTPIAVLKHCHGRIRLQLDTLERLQAHLPAHGADEQAQKAAAAIVRYFSMAAELHHEDEEEDLLPLLRTVAEGEDAATLDRLVPDILAQHVRMHAAWQKLSGPLAEIAAGRMARLQENETEAFRRAYLDHMTLEETHIAPMAVRLFDAARMAQLGNAMRARRGVAAHTTTGE